MRRSTILAAAVTAAFAFPIVSLAGTTPPEPVTEFVPVGTAPQAVGSSGVTAECNALSAAPCALNTVAGAPQAVGSYSVASGLGAYAGGAQAVALGYQAVADGAESLAAGSRSTASGAYAVALGHNVTAAGMGSVAQGWQAQADDNGDVAIGESALANANQGTGATAPAGDAVAIGPDTQATAVGAAAFGNFATASGTGSLALGQSSFSTGDSSVAIGGGMSSGTSSVAIGGGAAATGTDTIANGFTASAGGSGSIAFGASASADSLDNGTDIAIGPSADVTADGGVAVGEAATAGGFGTAVGDYSNAAAGSVALGEESVAETPDTVSVGSDGADGIAAFQRSISNVAPGTNGFDAVNVSQLNAGGAAIAAWIGAGAAFNGSGAGTFTAPSFVLSNPYTAGTFGTVSGALAALDTGIADAATAIAAIPATGAGTGAQGATGAQGPAGAAGPQGKPGANGVGVVQFANAQHTAARVGTSTAGPEQAKAPVVVQNVAPGTAGTDAVDVTQMQQGDAATLKLADNYTDTHAVEYVPHSDPIVALRPDTTLENVAAGTAPTDAVNVAQLDESQAASEDWARSYTNYTTQRALTAAEQYTNAIGAGLNRRVDYALSAAGADAQAAAALAGQSSNEPNRIAVGTGWTSGVVALNVTYQHLLPDSHWAWNVGLTRSAGYESGTTVSAGASYGW